MSYDPNPCRLAIDGSIPNLKVLFLKTFIATQWKIYPTTHSVHLKKSYANVKHLLGLLIYEEHKWKVTGELEAL